ncbi:hypothetical protein AZE42_11300 [Rhizopogon vesiculosus]|uniref:Uncharacterized protein n=1 Tax=Rhizopogon vesiculosus TaxID=180088 RepID=A0A1J8Q2P9_9AGAM|nr:hypothetical protein AZE42_11300 [Rhizopogon vesiculosus]
MITALDAATTSSSDPPDAIPVGLGSRISQRSVERPPIDIDPTDLATSDVGRVSHTRLAELYHCHPQTICRRLLYYGLSAPGPSVYVDETRLDGSTARTYFPGSSSDLSLLSDGGLGWLIFRVDSRRLAVGWLTVTSCGSVSVFHTDAS